MLFKTSNRFLTDYSCHTHSTVLHVYGMKQQCPSSPAIGIKCNQYGRLIHLWFGGWKKKKKTRLPSPAPTHCLEYTSHNCLRQTKKAELCRPWQAKNRLLIVPALFSQDNVWGSAESSMLGRRHTRCCMNKTGRHTRTPLYRHVELLLHTHPPLTAVHKIKSEKHKDKAERWHFMLSEGGFLIFAHFRVTKVQR